MIDQQNHLTERAQTVSGIAERDSMFRDGHYARLLETLGVNEKDLIVQASLGSFAVQRLILFDDLVKRTSDRKNSIPLTDSGGKRLSMGLGHVNQKGKWGAAHELDQEIRFMPDSHRLRERGFRFDKIQEKENAAVRYRIQRIVVEPGIVCINAVRTRAVADIHNDDREYDIIRRSSFLIEEGLITDEQLGALRADPTRQYVTSLGNAIIEPALKNIEYRRQHDGIVPVTSHYFALMREEVPEAI